MVIPELKNTLRSLGVKRGDVLCVFSDITSFGFPVSIKEQTLKEGLPFLLDSYIETFQDVVGEEGVLLMPTFTYSACHNQVFNVSTTPSIVGSLTEYFRKKKGVKRSMHPVFSFAGWGKKSDKLLEVEDFDCFGEGSMFGKLHALNATYIMFGVDIQHGATYVYYSEQKAGVYYRYFKNFHGVIEDKGKATEVDVRYYVRDLNVDYRDYWYDLEKAGLKKGLICEEYFNGGRLLALQSQEIDEIIQEELRGNRDFLIKLK